MAKIIPTKYDPLTPEVTSKVAVKETQDETLEYAPEATPALSDTVRAEMAAGAAAVARFAESAKAE